MEECYEYLHCTKENCIKRKIKTKKCWEIENTLCDVFSEHVKDFRSILNGKSEACKLCIYYQQQNDLLQEAGVPIAAICS